MDANRVTSNPNAKQQQSFHKMISHFQKPSRARSIWQLVNSMVPYFGLVVVMYFCLSVSVWLTMGIGVIAAGFLIRIFIIFHDCGHGSFFKSQKANHIWGIITGILTYTPYYFWGHKHAIHHATSGDLDKRGIGDVWTMTVKEYLASSTKQKFKYRFYRNPFVLHFLGPLQILLIQNRRVPADATKRERKSIWGMNLALLAVMLTVAFTVGIKFYLIVLIPTYLMAASAGIWLFYVQHQFEDVYWERKENWDFIAASLDGSSFYKLPRVIQWFTGNIGFHHIHHLSARIPNYNLPKCHAELNNIRPIKPVTFFRSLKSLNFRLWDEDNCRLISFGQLRQLQME